MGPESPAQAGVSGLQVRRLRSKWTATATFLGGVYIPLHLPPAKELAQKRRSPLLQAQESLDLPIPPPKLVDLWRIEGEGPDLLLHQSVLHFPLIHLRESRLGFPLGKPRHLVVLNLAATFVWQIVGAWEPPNPFVG